MLRMSAHFAIGIMVFACGMVIAMIASLTVFKMVDQVNEKLPGEQKFSHLWWYWSKQKRLFGEYRRHYPDGRLIRRYRILVALLGGCFLVTVWSLGFFSR